MTAIPPGHAVDWYRVPLPPGLLDQLNRRSDLLGSAQTLGYLAICVATGAYAVWAAAGAHWGHLAAALILHGTVCAFMINAVHELVHGTVFRTRWLNTAFAHLFAFIGWINHRGFWASHAEHHLHTMHFPYDQENVFPIRYRLADFLRAATCDPRGMYWNLRHHARVASGRLDGDWERHLFAGQPRHREVVAWSRWLLAGHAAVAVASIATGWWIVPIVVSLTPVYCRGLFWLLNNAQHVGLMESAPDFRLNCRTIVVNPVFRFLYWHMNWHIEHHMYAAVPCYRLHALHQAIRPQLPHCPRGLVETWYTIIGIMWRQEREPGWTFRQELPGETRTAAAADPATATAPTPAAAAPERRRVWRCSICGFVYDSALGLPAEGIAPGTAWDAIPDAWRCPDCGVAKSDFAMVELSRPQAASATTAADPIVIVGGGMAAAAVVRELRRRDATRPMLLLTRDAGELYAKPGLSSCCRSGGAADDLVSSPFASLGVQVSAHCEVTGIDRSGRRVLTASGPVAYDRLVLALGSEAVRPEFGGDAAERVLTVDDLDGYRALRRALPAGGRIAIIGGGLIGCEFADDLRHGGHQVRVIDRGAEPLAGLVPPAMGARLRRSLQDRGIAWHAGTRVAAVDARDGALVVTLLDGSRHAADVVLAATGTRPRTGLARQAGLEVRRGVVVGAGLATSDPRIHAIGDCTEIDGRVRPFVQPILHAAGALADALCGGGGEVRFPPMPIVVKTPACPIVALPPEQDGCTWEVEELSDGIAARALRDGRLAGFALCGGAVARRDAMLEAMREPAASAS